jgi:hypothetical protein
MYNSFLKRPVIMGKIGIDHNFFLKNSLRVNLCIFKENSRWLSFTFDMGL